jgi:hypothetical protein
MLIIGNESGVLPLEPLEQRISREKNRWTEKNFCSMRISITT